MNKNLLDPLLPGKPQKREKMIELAVNAAIGDQSHQMERSLPCRLQYLSYFLVAEKIARFDGFVDAGNVLMNHTPGPDIEMADFAVSHQAFGKADSRSARLQGNPGVASKKLLESGQLGLGDSVALLEVTETPAVQNCKYEYRWS